MGFPVVAMAVVSAAAAAKSVSDIGSASAKKKALDAQAQQSQLQYLQKTNENYSQVQHLLGTQINQASVRGVDLSSPSLNAIQRDTINIFSKDQANLDTENDFVKRNVSTEKRNVDFALAGELFGNLASAAATDFDIGSASGSFLGNTKAASPAAGTPSYVKKLKRQVLNGK